MCVCSYTNSIEIVFLFFFNLEFGSENFDKFLSVLGEKITLKGWERFRGGLDVKGNKSFSQLQTQFDLLCLR